MCVFAYLCKYGNQCVVIPTHECHPGYCALHTAAARPLPRSFIFFSSLNSAAQPASEPVMGGGGGGRGGLINGKPAMRQRLPLSLLPVCVSSQTSTEPRVELIPAILGHKRVSVLPLPSSSSSPSPSLHVCPCRARGEHSLWEQTVCSPE